MSQIAIWAAVAAVIVDSVVTIIVGVKLTRTARKETAKAAESLKPVLQAELANAALLLIPLLAAKLKEYLGEEKIETARPISIIGNKPKSDHG